jgi:uncharacterized protein (DUF2236 family)
MTSTGLFGPGSAMWRINRERVVLLGGPAAAVLQVAHPMVARGVARHSRFREDSVGRLARTLDAVYGVAFGTDDEVRRIESAVARAHARVRGDGYSAFDPAAQKWVMATLIMGSASMFERYVGPIPRTELDRLLEENDRFGAVFGLPRGHLPTHWPTFLAYWHAMLHGPELGSDPLCARVAQAVLKPQAPFGLRMLAPFLTLLAVAEMPQTLAARLGLPDPRRADALTGILRTFLPFVLRRVGPRMRFAPRYLEALRRGGGTPGR